MRTPEVGDGKNPEAEEGSECLSWPATAPALSGVTSSAWPGPGGLCISDDGRQRAAPTCAHSFPYQRKAKPAFWQGLLGKDYELWQSPAGHMQ